MKHYLNFMYINLAFIAQIVCMVYFRSAADIKENWPLYRCNPSYWIFSDNLSEDFTYCVQNSQVNMMGYLLQPMNYMISGLTSVSSGLSESINNMRGMFSNIRQFVTKIIENVFGVFFNLIVELQKMIISIKDLVGKMIGIVVTILYVLDGSIKTMNSAWSGPPGQLVKAIGSCFHPDTLVKLKCGQVVPMIKVPLGAELVDGSRVQSVMRLYNFDKSPFYQLAGGVNRSNIYVTGDHFIYDGNKWIQVKDCLSAIKTQQVADEVVCLITTNRNIRLGNRLFWDWEDDELTALHKN